MKQFQSLHNYLLKNKVFFGSKTYSDYRDDLLRIDQFIKGSLKKNLVLNYSENNPIVTIYLISKIKELNFSLILGEIEKFDKFHHDKLKISYLDIKDYVIEPNSFYLTTSGTTGKPKLIKINFDNFFGTIKHIDEDVDNWLLTYNSNTYAGLQVIMTAALNYHFLFSSENNNPKDLFDQIIQHNINRISGTPTFWKLFLNFNKNLSLINLKNITLGGEIAEQELLNKLKSSFPDAKINHIYATTETGVVFSVSDTLEGFPKDYLEKYNLKIDNNELHVQRKDGTWFNTKDICDIVENRVLFKGRDIDNVKIAGRFVNILDVEKILMSSDLIDDVLVYAKKNPITGNILTAEIKLKKINDQNKREINNYIKNLNKYMRPSTYKIVDKILLNKNLKKSRISNEQ